MSDHKLGDLPAFPTGKVYDEEGAVSVKDAERPGMTRREYIATKAMQGLVMGASDAILRKHTDSTFAERAVMLADALLAELSK